MFDQCTWSNVQPEIQFLKMIYFYLSMYKNECLLKVIQKRKKQQKSIHPAETKTMTLKHHSS